MAHRICIGLAQTPQAACGARHKLSRRKISFAFSTACDDFDLDRKDHLHCGLRIVTCCDGLCL